MDIKNKAYNVIDTITGRKTFTDKEKSVMKDFIGTLGRDLRNESKSTSKAIDKIVKEQVDRLTQTIQEWRDAQAYAEDPKDPDPFDLYQLYLDILDDDQVHSTKQQRIAKATGGLISLKDMSNEVDKEATAILIKPDGTPHPWFREFLQICMMSKFYGYSIAQFREPVNGKFVINPKNGDKPVENIPYENMVPMYRAIRKDINVSVQDESNLIPVYGGPGSKWLIACGKDKDIGLLNKVAPFWIWKKAFGYWSQHASIFGMPFRKGNTNIHDNKRLQNMIDMFENMTGATYFIGHEGDEVDISYPTGSGTASDIYDKLIQKCDQAIAKIVLSQTGTTDEKSYAGSANVHAGVLEDVIWSDKLDLAAIIDEQLIPFLKSIGMMPENKEVFASWDISEKISMTEWAEVVSKLAMVFDLDAKELGKKFNLSLENKEVEASPMIPTTAAQEKNKKDLQNAYKKYLK